MTDNPVSAKVHFKRVGWCCFAHLMVHAEYRTSANGS